LTTVHTEAPTLVADAGEGLAAELLARRRRKLPRPTLALALAAVAVVVFIAGALVQREWGGSSSTSSTGSSSGLPAGFPTNFPSGLGGGGATTASGGGPSSFGNQTSGTVTLIKGSTLYVTEASGTTVLVHTSVSSRVTKSVTGTVRSIHPGDTVTVAGNQGKGGAVTARQITISASSTSG
jgi:hypothetical protein